MPELKPLPCPACGFAETDEDRFALSYRLATQLVCPRCGVYGPTGEEYEEAITAWNSLPRALTWGEEPKLGEWNWWGLDDGSKMPRYVFSDGTIDTEILGRIPWQDIGGQWAGPIAPPTEQK